LRFFISTEDGSSVFLLLVDTKYARLHGLITNNTVVLKLTKAFKEARHLHVVLTRRIHHSLSPYFFETHFNNIFPAT